VLFTGKSDDENSRDWQVVVERCRQGEAHVVLVNKVAWTQEV